MAVTARVFAAQGYDRTTMQDLSRASRMSLAGMYYYVKGKEDLLFEIQRGCFERVRQDAEQALAEAMGGGAEERLQAFIRHHVTFFANHMDEMQVLSHEAGTAKRSTSSSCTARATSSSRPGEYSDAQEASRGLYRDEICRLVERLNQFISERERWLGVPELQFNRRIGRWVRQCWTVEKEPDWIAPKKSDTMHA